MTRLGVIFLLASCNGGTEVTSLRVAECPAEAPFTFLLAFDDPAACDTEDPGGVGARRFEPVDQADWDRESAPPRLEVPVTGPLAVVARCSDEGGVVRAFGCDDDADGAIEITPRPTCTALGAQDPCPPDARLWAGGDADVCVVDCLCQPLDEDEDGDASVDCGGTDCDDTDEEVHPGADDAVGDALDTDCDGEDG